MTAVVVDGPKAEDPDPPDGELPWSWHLSRASAIALAVLLPIHVVSFHIQPAGAPLTAQTLAGRWSTPWRLVDWLTLVLALVHGALASQPQHDGRRAETPMMHKVVGSGVAVVAAAVIGVLTYAVFSYGLF